jgi:hypothetical protein
MKSAKQLIFGFLAFAILCGACATIGAIAYSAGGASQPTAIPSATATEILPTPTAVPASDIIDTSSGVCAVKIYADAGTISGTVYEVVTGPGHDALCEFTMQSIAEVQSDPDIQVDLVVIDFDPGYPSYCQKMFGSLKAEIQADNELMGAQFCNSFLNQ